MFAQLRDVLTAEDSTIMAEENENCGPLFPEGSKTMVVSIAIRQHDGGENLTKRTGHYSLFYRCWNLQYIGHLHGGPGLRGFVNVRQDRKALSLQPRQDSQAFGKPWSTVRTCAAAVGFVEGSLEDEGTHRLANFGSEKVDVLFALDDARPRD